MEKITELGIFNEDWPVGSVLMHITFDPPIRCGEEREIVVMLDEASKEGEDG